MMRAVKWGMAGVLVMVAASCLGDTNLFHEKISESITIQASPEKVWALVGDFDDMAHWDSAVARSTTVDGDNEAPTRAVFYKEGVGKEVDVLDERSDAEMTLRYRMLSGPWPVNRYNAVLHVKRGPTPGTTVVEWRGSFDIPGVSIDPDGPPSLDMPSTGPMVFGLDIETYNDPGRTKSYHRDQRTVQIIRDLYRVGLDSLKWVVER